MASFKIIAKLPKLKGMKVTGLSFHHGGVVRIAVKPFKNGCRCPECGRRGAIVRTEDDDRIAFLSQTFECGDDLSHTLV